MNTILTLIASLILGNRKQITHPPYLSFSPSSVLLFQLHSLLSALHNKTEDKQKFFAKWVGYLFPVALSVCTNTLWANDISAIESQSTTCANCHGAKGNNQDLQGPNLAGQNHQYLIKQINVFSKGTRIHPLLSSDEFKLETDEINNLANYYASMKPDNSLNQLNKEGELIYSTCSDCHGEKGEGIAPFPRLSGQKPAYLKQQLVNFKTGVRQNAVMQAMSVNLSDEEIKQLAGYLGSQIHSMQ